MAGEDHATKSPISGVPASEDARPAWLEEVIDAVGLQIQARTAGAAGDDGSQVERLTEALPNPSLGPGWYWVDLSRLDLEPELVESGWLSPVEALDQDSYGVIEAVQDGSRLNLRVGGGAPASGLYLWRVRPDPAFLLESLKERLMTVAGGPLVDCFRTRRLPPPPAASLRGLREISVSGLRGAQARVWTACCAPGLHLVWGPPGKSKTHAVARALQELCQLGSSVLLVSRTAISVDSAVQEVVAAMDPPPGRVVRVGTPGLAAVAADSRLSLRQLVRAGLEDLERQRRDVELRILTLRHSGQLDRADEARRLLRGFDEDEYHRLRARAGESARFSGLKRKVQQRRAEWQRASSELATAVEEHERARAALDQVTVAAAELAEAERLSALLQELTVARERATFELEAAETERAGLDAVPSGERPRSTLERIAGWFALDNSEGRVVEADRRLAGARRRLREAEQALAAGAELRERIQRCQERAAPATVRDVRGRRAALEAAARRLQQSRSEEARLITSLRAAESELAGASYQPSPSESELRFLAEAEARGLPQLAQEQRSVEEAAARVSLRLDRLCQRHEELLRQQRGRSAEVERRIVASADIVATTFTSVLVKPALYERTYDHVVVDDAAAASLPEILYAVSRATVGATLIGDTMQSGPVLEPGLQESREPRVERWLKPDCFKFFGIARVVGVPEESADS